MLKKLLQVGALCSVIVFMSGCAGLMGPAVGAATGGPSLTTAVYDDSWSLSSKILSAPFIYTAGTAAGIPIGLYNGFGVDAYFFQNGPSSTKFNEAMINLVDPFGGLRSK